MIVLAGVTLGCVLGPCWTCLLGRSCAIGTLNSYLRRGSRAPPKHAVDVPGTSIQPSKTPFLGEKPRKECYRLRRLYFPCLAFMGDSPSSTYTRAV